MSLILVVDDQPSNREVLTTLLGYYGHSVFEAADGAEGLSVAAREQPDLIISDVLMPTMDGYEFVRKLREDPKLAAKPVVFYTAFYLEREALALAEKCGVSHVIPKPCEPSAVLDVVNAAMGVSPKDVALPPGIAGEHLELITTRLSRTAEELLRANSRLETLIESGQKLATELDPEQLVEQYSHVARQVVGAGLCAIGILDESAGGWSHVAVSGVSDEAMLDLRSYLKPDAARPNLECFKKDSFSLEIRSANQFLGWFCLGGKLGGGPFEPDDEKLGRTLAAQLAVAYENVRLYAQARKDAKDLEQKIAELRASNAEKVVLQKEVHHRVNNNLAVIGSLLRLQAESSKDDQVRSALQTTQLRIDAMSQIHQQLYSGQAQGLVDFAEYARRLADHLFRSYGIDSERVALRVQIDALKLSAHTAIPLGLILGELVTNALKYAFPGERRGTIHIEGGRPDGIELIVRDDGVGICKHPEPSERKPLGMQIVGILCRQLNGTLEQTPGAGGENGPGTVFRLSFPGGKRASEESSAADARESAARD